MKYRRFIPWFLAALVAALLGVAVAAGHLIATSVTDDSSSISTTDLPVSHRQVIVASFRSKLAPRAGSARLRSQVSREPRSSHLVVSRPDVSREPATAWAAAATGRGDSEALAAAAEAVAVAARATKVTAQRARRVLAEATQLALDDASEAAARAEHDAARRAADDAVALAAAAERAERVAAEAGRAERAAELVARDPGRYGVRDLPSLPEPLCFSVGRETGYVDTDVGRGGASAAWAVTNDGASLCRS